jgi:DMSO reductase iron-sulfur subunit
MANNTRQYGMVIDTSRCIGCQTCTISCKISNTVPGDAHWNHLESLDGDILYQATGSFPQTRIAFRPCLCNHCERPLCVANCPSGAMQKDPDTGIVSVDQDVCIGCGTCKRSCPYDAPQMDVERQVMGKCNLCADRLEDEKQPYCVQACPVFARILGDINDPSSEASVLIREKLGQQFKPENDTSPSVYYL